jgi:sulfur carrier protein
MMEQTSILPIRVNGEERHVAHGATVADLLAELGSTGKRVAVERNGEIVPRSKHTATRLEPGDRVEIVIAVGGG